MDFNDINSIKKAGFVGFKTIAELFVNDSEIPKIKGVYMVLHYDTKAPNFLDTGTGGHFKGKDPNIKVSELKNEWVDGAKVVYIGKAGSITGSATLYKRLRQYFGFGQGKNIGHYGGRLIWQINDSKNLIVCWKPLPNDEPGEVESSLIQDFRFQFKKRPFANLKDQ